MALLTMGLWEQRCVLQARAGRGELLRSSTGDGEVEGIEGQDRGTPEALG